MALPVTLAAEAVSLQKYYERKEDLVVDLKVIQELYNTIRERKLNPMEGAYTSYLFEKGLDKILKKVGEECTEVIIAAKNENKDDTIAEVCDLFYHIMVLMTEKNITLDEVLYELERRRMKIGNKKPERCEITKL